MEIIIRKISVSILSLCIFVLPTMAYGAGLIPCGDVKNADGVTTNPCGFYDLIKLANSIVHFLMYDVAVPLAALGFMYMGARMVLFSNKEAEKTAAVNGLWDIVTGFGIMLGAYVLIKTILAAFLSTDYATFVQNFFQ